MLLGSLAAVFAALAYIHGTGAAPQLTTAIPLGIADSTSGATDGGVVSGIIAGTGPDGTTFILTPEATGSGAIPITVTVVEGASGFTAQFAASSGDFVHTQSVGCGLRDGLAQCTEAIAEVSASQTASTMFTTSGVPALATIVVSTSSVPVSDSNSGPAPTQSPQPSSANRKRVDMFTGMMTLVLMLVAMA